MDTQLASSRTNQPQKEANKQINWQQYNYPPLLKLMHFRPSQLPDDKKSLVLMLFSVHVSTLFLSLLNFIDNCIEGGLGILYSGLFMLIWNPIILFLFYRAYIGLCRDKSGFKLYLWLQPVAIIVEIVISIVDFLGFNGFIRVGNLFDTGYALSGILALVVSCGYILIALFSAYLYYRVWRERSFLAKVLM